MAALIAFRTFFALHPERWRSIRPRMFFFGAATVLGASLVLTFSRFGGLLVNSPQEFAQMALILIWGWLFLGAAIWAIGRLVVSRVGSNADQPSLIGTLTSVGFAHRPILILGAVIFVSAGLLQTNGPGLVVAIIAFGIWLPALLVLSVQYSRYIERKAAFFVVIVPYLLWLFLIARFVLDRVSHLL